MATFKQVTLFTDTDGRARFREEGIKLARVQHPKQGVLQIPW